MALYLSFFLECSHIYLLWRNWSSGWGWKGMWALQVWLLPAHTHFIFSHFLFTCPTSPSQPCVVTWWPVCLQHSQHLNRILLPVWSQTFTPCTQTHTHRERFSPFTEAFCPYSYCHYLQNLGNPLLVSLHCPSSSRGAQGWVNPSGMPTAAFPQLAVPDPK